MKKLVISLIIIIVVAVAGIAMASFAYTNSKAFGSDKFDKNTYINGVNCSGLTAEEAKDKISASWNKKHLVVRGGLDEILTSYSDFGCTYNIEEQLENLKSKYKIHMALNHYLHLPIKVSVAMKIDEYSQAFEETVKNTDFLRREGLIKSQDAYVDLNDDNFPIVKEIYGNSPDKSEYFKDVLKAIELGENVMVYDENKYITPPEIKSDNKELLEYQEFCRNHLNMNFTYTFGEEKETIDREQLKSFFKEDMSGEVDKDVVKSYVNNLAKTYDTVGRERKFKSLTGKNVTVSGGTYGWRIDQNKEVDKLIEDLNAGKDVERNPVYAVKGSGEYTSKDNDLGNTYVDVDITKQHVTYFRDGKKVFECDCVTGNKKAGHSTPTGTFYIINHHRNLVLKGNNDDGSKYASPVKYWCGFYASSHGFHDADWRSSFGGSIYISNGSHGCINMPPKQMPKFYDKVQNGDPVIVHK